MKSQAEDHDQLFCRRCDRPMTILYPLEGKGLRQVWCCTGCSVCRIVRLAEDAQTQQHPSTVLSHLAT